MPIWNTNVFGGQSFAGELQPGVFYPINLVWLLLFGSVKGISEQALNFLVVLHFLIAAFGTYLFIKQLSSKKWVAFLVGLVFAVSGMVAFRSVSQTVIFFGFALVPYPLFFLAKYHAQINARWHWLVACGASLGIILLSGHIDPLYFALLMLALFELSRICRRYTKRSSLPAQLIASFRLFFIVGITAGIVALPQLIISAGYLPHAYRIQAVGYAGPNEKISYRDFSKTFNVDIHEGANLIDPVSYSIKEGNNIFIGLVPLGIIILALCFAKDWFKKTKIWAEHAVFANMLLVISIIAMLGYVTWFAVVLYEIPGVYQIRELGRYSLLFHVGAMLLLAASLEAVTETRCSKQQKTKIFAVGVFLLLDGFYLLLLRHHIFSLHNALQIVLLSLLLLMLAIVDSSLVKRVGISGLIILTLLTNTLWFLPHITPRSETPNEYTQLPHSLVAVLEQTNGTYRVDIPTNTIPVNTGNVYNVQTMGGYAATVYAPYFEFLHKSGIDPEFIRDIFGVRLVVQSNKPLKNQQTLYADSQSSVYAVIRPTALSKFFSTTKLGSLQRSDYHDIPSTTQIYNDHEEEYTVTSSKDETAIVSEIAYRGWTASIDGRKVALKTYILAGKPLLKSIELPAGTHHVALSYKPFGLF